MKMKEARRLVTAAFPGRTVCVTRQAWYSERAGGMYYEYDYYLVAVQPGWSGKACDMEAADELEKAVNMVLQHADQHPAMQPPPPPDTVAVKSQHTGERPPF